MTMTDNPFRPAPATRHTRYFWTGGEHGELSPALSDCGTGSIPAPQLPERLVKKRARSGFRLGDAPPLHQLPPWIRYDPPIVRHREFPKEGSAVTTGIVNATRRRAHRDSVARCVDNYDELFAILRASIRRVGERARCSLASAVGRWAALFRNPLDLTLDACLAAIDDAGLTRDDIDGIATYPGNMDQPPGFSGAGVTEVHDALRLNLNWFAGGLEAPGQLGSVVNACLAVSAGLANHVLCFRTVWEGSAQGSGGRAGIGVGGGGGRGGGLPRLGGFMQWTIPYGAASAANWIAIWRRATSTVRDAREQLRGSPERRRNAALNPRVCTGPDTLDDTKLAWDWPFCLYDCDVPADVHCGVVSRATRAACQHRFTWRRRDRDPGGSLAHGRPHTMAARLRRADVDPHGF